MAGPRIQLPAWSWSYVTFRLGDGASNALIPLAVVLHYHLPLWALALVTAAMNLSGVPAAFLWGTLVDRGIDRRRLVTFGFAMAAVGMAVLAWLPSIALFTLGAMLYTVFGVATSPAASTMVLQNVDRADWGRATGTLSRRTGLAYLTGMSATAAFSFWRPIDFSATFAACAVMAMGAALVARRTLPAMLTGATPPADAGVVPAGQRWFERTVFFPARLANPPTVRGMRQLLADPGRLWPIGYALTFMGSISFFTSYPGVLAGALALPAGLVLLLQMPSQMVTPLAYPWAGRHGIHKGESRAVVQGSLVRSFSVPVMCSLVAFAGAKSWPLLLLLHGTMGISFALIQVNGPLLLARLHPGGRGPGVGTYHAAVGIGTLFGALSAFTLLRFLPFRDSYLFSAALTWLGALCLITAHRRWKAEGIRAAAPGTAA